MNNASVRKLPGLIALAIGAISTGCAPIQMGEVRPRVRPVEVIIDATDLATAFEESDERAAELFGGRVGRINGHFAKSEPMSDGHIAMTFKRSIETFRPVRCIFDATDSTALNKFTADDEVSVTGRIGGFAESKYFVSVDNCVVEEDH